MIPETERDSQALELAEEILTLSRNAIMIKLRFMDRAAGNFRLTADMNFRFAGSAAGIVYSPWSVIRMYQEEPGLVTRNLLHAMLHNVFRHSFVGDGIDRMRWDLAADIAVENAVTELGKDFLRAKREEKQAPVIALLKGYLQHLTAERIYSLLGSGEIPAGKWYGWKEIFTGDDHDLWYGGGEADPLLPPDADLEQLWREISRRMQTELEIFLEEESAMTQSLREINRIRYNYTEFLRRFGIRMERMRLSEEEFDNNYYTYGMDLYGDIPLIEPLEYSDRKDIRDFVIAIDTSGSVEGEIVQKFVQHTHDILTGSDRLLDKTNIYILQCDDRIREAVCISSADEFKRYLESMEIKGLGETDFRPVFAYVAQLQCERKLKDLRGLLYFTDGKGTFPAEAPGYDTAFIIHNDSMNEIAVPDWAMKVEMQTEEIKRL